MSFSKPKTAQFDEAAAQRSQVAAAQAKSKYGTYGVDSPLGQLSVVQNPDGTYTRKFDQSQADVQRQGLISGGLSGLSLDPSQAQDAYYRQATRQLIPQQERTERQLQEQLAARGITVGSELYNQQIEDLRNQQSGQLADISDRGVFQGQNLLGQQIGNIGGLAGQRDILRVPGLGGSTGANFQDTYSQKYQSDVRNAQMANQGNQALMGSIGSLAGLALGGPLGGMLGKKLLGGGGGTNIGGVSISPDINRAFGG